MNSRDAFRQISSAMNAAIAAYDRALERRPEWVAPSALPQLNPEC